MERNRVGWVAAMLMAACAALRAHAGKKCAVSLSVCSENGCADPQADPDHALVNRTKRTFPSGNEPAIVLTVANLRSLQKQADAAVGQNKALDVDARAKLRSLKKGKKGKVGEGSFVQVTGYLVGKIRPNAGESVNCGIPGGKNNDIHIVVGSSSDAAECDSFVVEMIPQSPQRRNGGWSKEKLQAVLDGELQVLISGQLMYDNMHKVNANCKKPLQGQPKRFTLWEIHPVTGFFVCSAEEGGCDPAKPEDWTSLEQFEI